MAVDKSPDAAKTRSEATAAANAAASKAQREKDAQHLADLKRVLGDVGKDNGQLFVGTDQYKNLILYENILDKKGNLIRRDEVFFWIQPDGVGFMKKYGSGVIKEIKTLYKGNLEKLRSDLFNKNFLSENDFTTKDETAFNEAILKAARNHSLTEVQKYTIEGQTKFTPFGNWLKNLGSVNKGQDNKSNLPVRDINLIDRDVVEAIVRSVYAKTTEMAPDEKFITDETDRYMEQIKQGTLTTITEKSGEAVRKTTTPFTQAQVEAELPKRIEETNPQATQYKKNFDFLAFLDGLGAKTV